MSDFLVPEHYTWEIQDSSKVQAFMDCPRKYFYRYILGWDTDAPNNHLSFGSAWHDAMEYLLLNGYGDSSVLGAYEAFLRTYRKDFPKETDELFGAKTPARVLEALVEYVLKYKSDFSEFEVLYTEIAGTVPLTEDRKLHFRQDAICKGIGAFGYFSLEHKTTGATISRSWMQQWPLSTQVGTYTHVLYCLYPAEEVYGVRINGSGFLKTKFSFERIPISKTKSAMQVWMWNTLFWLDQIQWNFELLKECKESDEVMMAFPMNTQNCSKWFGCPYHDFCTAWPNPLRSCDEVPMGLKIEFWDPMKYRPVRNEMVLGKMKGEENA